ncbi:hypothetical protein [Kordia zhangzhouensis]|uniref:hypothetical protein n=1 Tax=Kordia zhangzhouensis TaxID=1620405 RepID=UPI000629ACC4|nr:hypothetical protein [Kordia zhangzhouensis]
MKKFCLFFVLLTVFVSCDDGDLTLEEIDLTSTANVQACIMENEETQEGVTLLFKINGTETLILETSDDVFINEETDFQEVDGEMVPVPRTKTLNTSQASCYYRSFNESIGSSYFCDELPSNISSNLEYVAVAGTLEVTTVEILNGSVVESYEHTIRLREVVFTGDNGQDVRYGLFEFGTIKTAVTN